ncbi:MULTISPECIES: flagellin [Exiguobacterium]|uniref:flagellin N-terminal helical domain-containing protein n=1 Tax=Exiguobacterium TaxID=33986 RepID=UPI001BE65189|nr:MULTISPECIES: flagellin [Exiguobacterium]MCT4792623.1 flagellin [Exiguobacterium artemiae]
MIINHNITALNTHNKLSSASAAQSKSMEKLASGLRINKAGDDAAGLAISEKMRGQVRGLDQASKNSQDGISMIQTAEGALNETHDILQRMRELAVQSGNDTNTDSDRGELQKEVDQLASEITRISNNTEFNTKKLLDGGIKSGNISDVKFHIGANKDQNLSVEINAMDAKTLGVTRDVAVGTVSSATNVTGAKFSGNLGTGVVDGASIAVTAAVQAQGSIATTTAAGFTFNTADNSDSLNGYTITVSNTASASAATATVDKTNKTIALQVNDTSTTETTAATVNTALNAALTTAGITDVRFAATGSATTGSGTGTGTLTGGTQDTVRLTATSGATVETVDVKGNAKSAKFTDVSKFNGVELQLNGNLSSGTGTATTSTAATIAIDKNSSTSAAFANSALSNKAEVAGGIDISSQSTANAAVEKINTAIETVSAERSKLGASQNRLEHTINNLKTSSENLTAAESRIRDVDMAKEMMNQTKNSILAQAAQAMLAQSNQTPQGVLQLLR